MEEGSWFFGTSASGTTVRVRHDAPEDVPATKHDQRFWISELRLTAAHGLSDSLAMEVQLPYRVTRTTAAFRSLDGTPLPSGYESIHHRNETLRGFADPRVGARTGWAVAATSVSAGLGLTVPVGRIEPNPFERGEQGKKHQHIQFGAGTFVPWIDLSARQPAGPATLGLGLGVLLPWQRNEYGYQPGLRANGSLQASLPAWRKLEPGVRLDIAHEEPERWDGRVQQDGNVGRTDVLVAASLGIPAGAYRLSIDVAAGVWSRVPETHGDRGQLEYPGVVGVGITRSFGSPD